MVSDWQQVRLGEIVDFTPKRTIKKGTVAPFISMADVTENSKFITEVFEKEYTGGGSRFANGDTLFARITPCLQNGKCSKVSGMENTETGHGSTEFIVMAAKTPVYDEDYVYYLARLPKFRAYAESRMIGSTGRQRVSWQDLEEYEFAAPPPNERKDIGSFLSNLDDKIELNRQMNETLEAMAQALFKSWFVDFDPVIDNALAAGNAIPDEFAERAKQRKAIEKKDNADIQSLFPDEFEFTEEMGWIPKGWEISTLGQESDFSNGYAFKSKELTSESKDAFHVFKMGHIKRGGGFNYDGTKSYFPIEAAKDLERYLLKKGDLLMAMTDMKSSMALLGHTALMPEDDKFLVNQRVGRLSVKEDATLNYPYIYIYSNLDTTIGELRSRANSGVQVNLSTAEIKATNILVPSRSVHDIFNVKAISFFEKTFLNDRLNRKLAETRDTLLPKLMSGEICISDAEALVENV